MSNFKYYLRIWGMRGESKAKRHEGDIELLSYSFYNPARDSHHSSGGTGSPRRESKQVGNWTATPGKEVGFQLRADRRPARSARFGLAICTA